jgi:hypothetical protein
MPRSAPLPEELRRVHFYAVPSDAHIDAIVFRLLLHGSTHSSLPRRSLRREWAVQWEGCAVKLPTGDRIFFPYQNFTPYRMEYLDTYIEY